MTARLRGAARSATAHPYLMLSVVAILAWLYGMALQGGPGGDWDNLVLPSRQFTGTAGLHLYARQPQLTFGPLTLLVVIPLRYLGPDNGWQITSATLFALGLASIRLLDAAAKCANLLDASGRARVLVVGGTLLLISWIGPAGVWGHADDVLALLAIAGAIWCASQGRWVLAGILVGVGAGFKPWAIFAIALAMHGDARRLRGPAIAVVAAILPWLPFEIADHGTTGVTHVRLQVYAASGLRLLGVHQGSQPAWTHSLQLAVAVAAGVVVVVRRRWALVPLVAFVARVELDPAAFSYYGTGVIFGALAADLIRPYSIPALRTAACSVLAYYVPEVAPAFGTHGAALADLQLVARLAIIPALLALPSLASRYDAVRAGRKASATAQGLSAKPEPGSRL